MSTFVYGFRPPDESWQKMKKVFDACKAADFPVPDKVYAFFGGESPDDSGVRIDLENTPAVTEYSRDMEQGYQIDLSKLPKDLKYIRFINCY
jgi:hypothetical protein